MLDRFDRVFGEVFKGLIAELDDPDQAIPEEWLKQGRRALSHPRADGARSRRSAPGTRSWRR